MPLFLDDTLLKAEGCRAKCIVSDESLVERSRDFPSKPKRNLGKDDKVLYISQREYGTISKQDNTCNFVGSDDATTCHILVLISGKAVSIGHFDGADTNHGLLNMIKEIEMLNSWEDSEESSDKPVIDAHIFGGFNDDRNTSSKLLEEILMMMSTLEQEIHLITACVYTLNTKVVNRKYHPAVYGVAIDIRTNEIFPATFENKGPCEILRHARIFGGSNKMTGVYDYKSSIFVLYPFHYKAFRGANMVLTFDDDQILQNLSTSPHCEPDDFVLVTRQAIQFLLEHPEPAEIFKNWRELKFQINERGKWMKL